jgi:hypothetical protein
VFAISKIFVDSERAFSYGLIFFVLYPIMGYATIIISDRGLDIAKSLPPLLVSIGKEAEPLREMRAKLQETIRKTVLQWGPELFPEIKDRIESRFESEFKEFDAVSAKKLGRGDSIKLIWDDDEEWDILAPTMSAKTD